MHQQIYQIKITLKGSKPPIWRRVLLPSETSLSDLHYTIQIVMGWENAHLHQFIKDRTFYAEKMEEDDFWDMGNNVDYTGMKISDLLKKEKDKMVYEYDFGDGWEHDVVLEKILPADEKIKHPVCIKGKMNCPPEDCGGIWGYYELLNILNNPKHPQHKELFEWMGEEKFDPEYFNLEKVNKYLHDFFSEENQMEIGLN
jgi:hypothetical protein